MESKLTSNRIYLAGIVEIHITNICNLKCTNCNRWSNYKFRGFERWEDYKDIYSEWASKVDFKKISLIGGEPMLNPTFMDWFRGLRKLWPNAVIEICTNGTRLDKVPGFYQEVLEHKDKTRIDVSIHHCNLFEYTTNVIKNFLSDEISTKHDPKELLDVYDRIKGEDWPDSITNANDLPLAVRNEIYEDFNDRMLLEPTQYIDMNDVKVDVNYTTFHNTVALKEDFTLHNSNPQQAHDVCFMSKCHTFYKGKFYKCPVTALLKDFVDQHSMKLSNLDRNLIFNPDYIDSKSSIEDIKKFWDRIESNKAVPQCKFCPANLETYSTAAEFKK